MSGNPIFAVREGPLLSHSIQRALAFLDLFAQRNTGV
jgi:hypothetical protein